MTWAEIAVSILGPEADISDFESRSFVQLGGDSIGAMRLKALARERLCLQVPVTSLLGELPLARVLKSATPVEAVAVEVSDAGSLLTEHITGDSPPTLVFVCFTESGRLEAAVLKRAVAEVIREVLVGHEPEFSTDSWSGQEGEFEGDIRRAAARFGHQPFDVPAAPAGRLWLISHDAGRQALVLSAHPVMLDGWAVGLLLRELFTRYDELRRGSRDTVRQPAVPVRVLPRLLQAQRASGLRDRQAESWRRHVADVPTLLELPSDRPRPRTQDTSGTRIPFDLGQAATQSVAERARWLGITQFAFLLGAFGLTLSRWTSARRLLVGVPLIGRDTPAAMNRIARAENLVPVRIAIDDDMTAADFLRSVRNSLVLSIDAGDLPFEELVSRLAIERDDGCHPLVQVSLGMHEQLVPERITTPSVRIRIEEAHGGACQFDLALMFGRADPSLLGYAEFSSSLWSTTDAEGFIADFCAAAEELTFAASPDATGTLEEVRCLSPDRRHLLAAINETERDFPASSLDELFREAASRWPTAMAVRDEAAELTYAQLARMAGRQAQLLQAAGVHPGDTVLVGLERSTAEIVAVLGTVSAGAAYVGVDLSQPDAHIARMVTKAKPAAALVGPADATRMMSYGVPAVETWNPGWAPAEADVPLPPASPGRLAYVAFTSGSTGQPKGVAVPHRAVIRLVHQAAFLRLGPAERMLRLAPLAFDASTLELWGALLNGATLEVCEPGILSPSELGAFLVDRKVTHAWLTSGLFRLVVDFAPDSLAGLRHLLTGGDVVPHEHVARALRRNPGLVITNGYGPTENTTFTAVYSVTRPEDVDGPLPIGTPVPGTRVYVLDERGRQVPPGGVGELYAGGEGLADGYFGDEAETARFFGYFCPEIPERLYRTGDMVRIDSRGRLRFLGRADDQVKVRGYRIELSAIGAELTASPDVKDAIVTVTEGDSADKRIMAAVILAPGATVLPADLRDSLADKLPPYMVPALWAVVDRMPLTANGKIDRRALAALAAPAGKSARSAPSPSPKS
jgi:amino acid adenylation domain-containing protein